MTEDRFNASPTYEDFLDNAVDYRDLWRSVYERTVLPQDLLATAREVPGRRHLLAVAADWCGEAIDPLPYVARLAEHVDTFEFRILDRDSNPDVMDAHLTDGARAIPIVIVYDGDFNELGFWGPRARPLQEWVDQARLDGLTSRERFLFSRRWHIRDKGRTTLSELLALMEPGEVESTAASSEMR